MKICYKINGILLVLVLGLLLNTSIANGKSAPTNRQSSSRTLRSMARVYMAYGEYAKAKPLAEKALTIATSQDTSDSELAMCLIDLATLYKNQNRLPDAERMCKWGLKLQRKTLHEKHRYLAYTLSTLGSIYCERGKYDQAGSALDDAMAIMLDSHSADDKAMAPFYVDIAKLHVAQDALEEAESYYQKAIDVIYSSYGANHLYTANVLADIASLYTMQKRYAEAETVINKAIAVQEKTYGANHHLVSWSWMTKAKICRVKGEYSQAEKLIKRALAATQKSGNTASFAKLRKDAKEIRMSKQVAYAPTIRTIE